MQCMEWPGNIRELSNGIARHVLIGPEATITEANTRAANSPPPSPLNSKEIVPLKSLCKEAIRASEKNIILAALRANHWNRRKAAQELKISYRLLIYKIRDAGLITKHKNAISSRQEADAGRAPSPAD